MKIKSIFLFLLLGGLIMTACKPKETKKVILLYGNFSYDKASGNVTDTVGTNVLTIPANAILNGGVIYGDANRGIYQSSIMVADEGEVAQRIRSFIGNGGTKGTTLSGVGGAAFDNPPPCPPNTQCPPVVRTIANFFEISVNNPIETASLPAK